MAEAPEKQAAQAGSPILAYIAACDQASQPRLLALRQAILEAVPGLTEKIAWSMPSFALKKNVIHFALNKAHIGIYPGPSAILHFEERLKPYKSSKGAVQLPHKEELPLLLVQDIARWCAQQPGISG